MRSLVGLDRQAVADAFAGYPDGTRFTVDQIRFVNLIVEELTATGVMEPGDRSNLRAPTKQPPVRRACSRRPLSWR